MLRLGFKGQLGEKRQEGKHVRPESITVQFERLSQQSISVVDQPTLISTEVLNQRKRICKVANTYAVQK
jgi:hypothetical protein